jgi:hypothetical protein
MSPRDELRRALDEVGRRDLEIVEVLSTMLVVRTGGEQPSKVAFAQLHDEWTIYGRATTKGGWSLHASGASIGEAVRALLAIGPDVFEPPRRESRDPIRELPDAVLQALRTIAVRGKLETSADATLRWMTVFAHDDWKTTHRAYRRALDVLKTELGSAREVSRRRRPGPLLRGAIWGKTALFESDHDPGAGALLQLAVWERGEPRDLPPWG